MTKPNYNHYNGAKVREEWPVGCKVSFRPKSLMEGEPLRGIVTGHMYVNVLIIEADNRKWLVSTLCCTQE